MSASDDHKHNDPRLYIIESKEDGEPRYLIASIVAELKPGHQLLSEEFKELLSRYLEQAKDTLRAAPVPQHVPWSGGPIP